MAGNIQGATSLIDSITNAFDTSNDNFNQNISTATQLKNERLRGQRERELLELQKQQFELTKLLGMQEYGAKEDQMKWQRDFRSALGRVNTIKTL